MRSLGHERIDLLPVVRLDDLDVVAVALVLHQPFKGRSLVRGLVIFPYMMPVVSVILVWMLLYNALYGVLNWLLVQVGIVDAPVAWLSQPGSAMPCSGSISPTMAASKLSVVEPSGRSKNAVPFASRGATPSTSPLAAAICSSVMGPSVAPKSTVPSENCLMPPPDPMD